MLYSEYLTLMLKLFLEGKHRYLCAINTLAYRTCKKEKHRRQFGIDMNAMLHGCMFITTEGNIPREAERIYREYRLRCMIGAAKAKEQTCSNRPDCT